MCNRERESVCAHIAFTHTHTSKTKNIFVQIATVYFLCVIVSLSKPNLRERTCGKITEVLLLYWVKKNQRGKKIESERQRKSERVRETQNIRCDKEFYFTLSTSNTISRLELDKTHDGQF